VKKKNILITGTKGFIGSTICKHFKKKKIKFRELKINQIEKNHKNISHLLHLQFFISKNTSKNFQKKNLNIIKKILKKCNKENIKLIFFSTCGVNFVNNDYTKSKKKCEMEILKFHKKFGQKFIILNIFNVYSNNLKNRGVIPDLIKKMKKNKKITIKFPNNTRDFIYIADVLEFITRSLVLDQSTYLQVGTGKATKIFSVAKKIKSQFGLDCRIIKSKHMRSRSNAFSRANLNLNNKFFNWRPKINIDTGIKLIKNRN
tara:strand:+ start:3055 stop:3831 length:777 start_codon:yes stop_codon:yes gene_type:complete